MAVQTLPIDPEEELLLPILPLIYVAWADGELSGDEIRAIRAAAGSLDDVSPGVRSRLERWLQIAAGVPLMCGEPEDYRSFRIGLFGLDKLGDIEGTVARLAEALETL